MTVKYIRTEAQAQRLLKRVTTKWSKLLGLWHEWTINVAIVKPDDLDNAGWAKGFETAAECSTHWEYQEAKMSFNEEWLRQATEKEIEETIVHEYQHVLLNELRRAHKMENEERTAVVLTRAFLRIHNGPTPKKRATKSEAA